MKALWLIPLIALGYIGWVNLMPLGTTASYFIDVGGEDNTTGKARLTGPFDRMSDKKDMAGISFRNLEKNPVYFELESRMLSNISEASVKVWFKDEFPVDGKFILGAENKTGGSYHWKECYIPFYNELAKLPIVTTNESRQVYATGRDSRTGFQSVDDFLQNPPLGSVVATNDKGLSISQESVDIDMGEFAARDVFPVPLAGDIDQTGYFLTATSLRGPHDFYFFCNGGALGLEFIKRDLNWYEGEEALDIIIYSLDGTLEAATTMPDDGDSTKGRNLGPPQRKTVRLDNLQRGAYRLVVKPVGGGADFVITHLKLNQSKLVMTGKVFLAGNQYFGRELSPMTVWCYLFSAGEIKFSTVHTPTLQNVTISGEGDDQTISIDAVGTSFSTGQLKAGIYKITSEKGNIIIDVSSGYFAFTEDSLFVPASGLNSEENGALLINTTLRGKHTLWTYARNAPLELEVMKQDLNWYEKPDELKVEVYSLSGELKGSASIPDDGDESGTKILGPLQRVSLKMEDLKPGAYRIELKGGDDLLIRQIQINQEKLVVDKRIFLVGTNPVYFKGGLAFDPVRLYGKNFKTAEIKSNTLHSPGLQRITVQSDGFFTEVDINKVNTDFSLSLKPGSYQLTVPRQNVVINSKGYFSFTPDSFFLPKRCEVVDLKYDLSWLRENVDYVVMNSKGYLPPVENGDWLVAQVTWKREDLFINEDKLSFCFNVPHLGKPGESEKAIPIDWIEISLRVLPIGERIRWGD